MLNYAKNRITAKENPEVELLILFFVTLSSKNSKTRSQK